MFSFPKLSFSQSAFISKSIVLFFSIFTFLLFQVHYQGQASKEGQLVKAHMDGWMDEWMDGWMDGWMNSFCIPII